MATDFLAPLFSKNWIWNLLRDSLPVTMSNMKPYFSISTTFFESASGMSALYHRGS